MNGIQCRMARAGLGWSAEALSGQSGVPIDVLARFERGETVTPRIDAILRDVFEGAGVIFEDEGQMVEGGPGVRLERVQTDEGKRPEELSSANDD